MKIIIAGSSGFIGSHLSQFFQQNGEEVIKLVRSPKNPSKNEILWDPENGILNPTFLEGVDVIINLAGENIASRRWNEKVKAKIRNSRVRSTETLAKCVTQLHQFPKVFINASAIGYYGNREDEILTENSPKGEGFLADVCREWEDAVAPITAQTGMRVILLRFGMVLSTKGGGLPKMLLPFKVGLGGVIGSGKQYMSWILLEELIDIISYVIKENSLTGPINVVTPHSVTNAEFTKTLGQILQRPTFLPLPSFAARLAFGEMADELLLNSTRVKPQRLMESGYQFRYPILERALKHLMSSQG